MVAQIIDGKALSLKIKENLARKIKVDSLDLCLAVILVGSNDASEIYVRNKEKAAREIGLKCRIIRLDEDVSLQELKKLIFDLNADDKVSGMILQLPLPKHLNALDIIADISPYKDVDGFSPYNIGLLQLNHPDAVIAATPKGVLAMIKSVCDDLRGKHAVVIGRSNIVGKPLASLLLNHDCSVSIVHSKTKHIEKITKQADILVVACGQPKMVKKDWVKKGAVVIDVGISRCDGKLCGDVDFDEVKDIAGFLSPVPGGVGPMTIAMLLDNVVSLR